MDARTPRSALRRLPAAGRRSRSPGIVGWLLRVGLVAGLGGIILVGVAVLLAMASLPSFDEMMRSPNGQSVEIKAADGAVLATLGPSYGEWLPYAQIPKPMVAAMIAVEDRRFRSHLGIDPIGIGRATLANWRAGSRVQGASTITQQLARNLFLTSNKSYARKLREMVLALALERRFTKEALLELYLNRVYFGGGAYGIDAASRRFFGHTAKRLTLSEAAVIAGLVKAPSRYAPSADPLRAKSRAATVIATMADSGAIGRVEAASADLGTLEFAPQERQSGVRYFTDWVLAEVETLTDVTDAPLSVTTTLDARGQRAAEAAIAAATPKGAQGALVSLARDGAVRAMVGGRDYVASNYNRAVVARRQPGSSFKLFVYLAALESGVEPDDRIVDEPVDIEGWRPRNSNGRNLGNISVREAFALSVNTAAAKLAASVGFDTVADVARRLGITTPIDRRPAMTLGSSEATVLEMTAAYAAIAAGGVEVRPYGVTRIATGNGELLYQRDPGSPRVVVAPYIAAKMTDLLKAAVETGTGRAAAIGRPLAGKTGTTSSNKDGWFLGFTSDVTTGVWMGRDDAKAVGGLQGGRAPAQAFAAYMRLAVRGTPAGDLATELAADEFGLSPDDEVYGITQDGGGDGAAIGPDGYPVDAGDPYAVDDRVIASPPAPPQPAPPRIDDEWLDDTLRGEGGGP